MKMTIEELKQWAKENSENGKRADAIRELIAIRELKGDQVPVEYQYQHTHAGKVWLTVDKPDYETFKKNGWPTRELFTAPQKPVVLPDGMKPCLQRGGQQSTSYRAIMTFSGDWLHRDMVIEAIEAAGGKVARWLDENRNVARLNRPDA